PGTRGAPSWWPDTGSARWGMRRAVRASKGQMTERAHDADVIIIGGGPAGSTLASLLAMAGHRALVLEKDIHPRDHVGESLVPSTNLVFDRIGFLEKMDQAGFVRKPGTGWN